MFKIIFLGTYLKDTLSGLATYIVGTLIQYERFKSSSSFA